RGFIYWLSTRVLELKPGRFRRFPGDYAYYMRRLEDETNGVVPAGTDAAAKSEETVSANKQRWQDQKKAVAERRKIERTVELLETQIAAAEHELKEAHDALADPAVYTNGEKAKATQQHIDRLTARLDDLTAQWEAAAEQLEDIP
ncbi:MAG: ABC transporter ATP-binding protein, partial [Treponemataceae bacterium]|nr:ABC transporter ATP-binding protein [Treponemataceae bacterium]